MDYFVLATTLIFENCMLVQNGIFSFFETQCPPLTHQTSIQVCKPSTLFKLKSLIPAFLKQKFIVGFLPVI